MAEYRALTGPSGEQHLNIDDTVKSLTVPALLSNTAIQGRAQIVVNGSSILYTLSGEDAVTISLRQGHTLSFHDTLIVTGAEMEGLKMTRATGKDSKVHVRYERRIN